jgi:murein DD-endopeptidase MepM/ murein hydrolase activator NlpD
LQPLTTLSRGKSTGPSIEQHGLFVVLLVSMIVIVLSGCRTAPQAVAAITGEPSPTPTSAVAAEEPTAMPSPPIVSSFEATATEFPSFSPQPVEDLASPTPSPQATAVSDEGIATASPAPEESVPVNATSEGTAEATSLPLPTFTPPATPDESTDDHYWLQRPVAAGGVVWTDKYYPYGSTRGGELRPHHGVEFNVPYGTEILAASAGTVVVAGPDDETAYGPHTNFYGNLVVLQHGFQVGGQPVFTLYGHLNEVLVTEGQQVSAQQTIGLSGATGVADGPHMHFEVRVGANSYDETRNPLLWLYPFPERGTIAGRILWPDGSVASGAPVSLNRIDGASPYYATTSYSGDTVNADEIWQENFAVDDVVAGFYEVVVRAGEEKYTAETWVYPYRTSFVEIVLDR